MKKIIFILLLSLIVFPSCKETIQKQDENVIATYYLIRHAEKDRGDKNNRDPHLTSFGRQRAENWKKHFKGIDFDAVYSTNYNRTKETATPTANANDLVVHFYDPSDFKIEEFIEKTKGQTVLIVGHSNTTPKFVNSLINEDKYKDIEDHNNANLYIVTFTKVGKTSELSVVN
ncbi:histidine phosphatase family protein [Winogradskyella eckloniae]|uniref:SixA phosphatase family protein n=1 Tax=Winogradskyella eckloniae TaxID=1089306 RepID=UPI001564333C|nr:phosphoglycerate mutase family protein [Winogradskyella eckloniae]NRD21177.1 histidine phosphatase family protein [Winogradskyella eckloniae]